MESWRLEKRLKGHVRQALQWGVRQGLPPAWLGYRWVQREAVRDYCSGRRDAQCEIVHPEATVVNPLPCNVASREELPADRGWWGYSFRDVPTRTSGETFIATLHDGQVVPHIDTQNEYWPAILSRDDRALELREITFRPGHSETLRRSSAQATRVARATWILERVYDNHSHWLTAHLPKVVLLQSRGALDDVLLPPERTATMDSSLRMLGLEPERFPTFDPSRPLEVGELTVLGTDRFRPELLRPVREAFRSSGAKAPHRRVYVSRAKASRRRLLNEEKVWPLLERKGFERVFMEDLSFEEQVTLMGETAILFAPHGAGLTNMMFCPEGAHVVEIADLSFPNPNFYALACAMGHSYWLLAAEGRGDGHPLEKDLWIQPEAVEEVLPRLLTETELQVDP